MKKLFALLLVAVMCFSLVACGGGNDTPTTDNNNEQQTNESGSQQETENGDSNESEKADDNGNSEFKRETTEEGYVVISRAEFASYITKVELTTENWQDYLDIVELTEQERNGFGEVVSTYTSTEFTAKNAVGCYFDDVAINFSVIETGDKIYCEGQFHRVIIPDNYSYSWEGYTINDFTCEKIVGDLIIFSNVPEECISAYEDGGKFICIGSKENYIVIDMNNTRDLSMEVSLGFMMK